MPLGKLSKKCRTDSRSEVSQMRLLHDHDSWGASMFGINISKEAFLVLPVQIFFSSCNES